MIRYSILENDGKPVDEWFDKNDGELTPTRITVCEDCEVSWDTFDEIKEDTKIDFCSYNPLEPTGEGTRFRDVTAQFPEPDYGDTCDICQRDFYEDSEEDSWDYE